MAVPSEPQPSPNRFAIGHVSLPLTKKRNDLPPKEQTTITQGDHGDHDGNGETITSFSKVIRKQKIEKGVGEATKGSIDRRQSFPTRFA